MSQQENKDMGQYFFRASAENFNRVAGTPISYWLSAAWFKVFEETPKLAKSTFSSEGIKTGNNERFLRLWFEVSYNLIGTIKDTNSSWVYHLKGGEYRKWYGNHEYVIYWKNNGELIKKQKNSGIQGQKSFNKSAVIWSDITSSGFSTRIKPENYLFDSCSPCGFIDQESYDQKNLLAYLK